MTPAARAQAAIQILRHIETMPKPADQHVREYCTRRRYIGAKDKSRISDVVYRVLAHYLRLKWWIEKNGASLTPRLFVISALALVEEQSAEEISALFSGGKYAPDPLSDSEKEFLEKVAGQKLHPPDMPEAVRVECPDWAEKKLRRIFGESFALEMEALTHSADLHLRINPLQTTRDEVLEQLRAEGMTVTPGPYSPWAVHVAKRFPVMGHRLYKKAKIDIQDEGSQLIARLVAAAPGMQVYDFCAGAGGKTLPIAMMMQDKGRVVASDVEARRLDKIKPRLKRARLHNIEPRLLDSEWDKWLRKRKGDFDRVLADVPCTGSGTWRRSPDMRWRQLGPSMEALLDTQRSILDSVARLVKPGGRLIYATCSLFAEENEDQISGFLERNSAYALLPLPEVWREISDVAPPCAGDMLRLTPASHGTDGFFAAVLVRVQA